MWKTIYTDFLVWMAKLFGQESKNSIFQNFFKAGQNNLSTFQNLIKGIT